MIWQKALNLCRIGQVQLGSSFPRHPRMEKQEVRRGRMPKETDDSVATW